MHCIPPPLVSHYFKDYSCRVIKKQLLLPAECYITERRLAVQGAELNGRRTETGTSRGEFATLRKSTSCHRACLQRERAIWCGNGVLPTFSASSFVRFSPPSSPPTQKVAGPSTWEEESAAHSVTGKLLLLLLGDILPPFFFIFFLSSAANTFLRWSNPRRENVGANAHGSHCRCAIPANGIRYGPCCLQSHHS